jgi:hypothetical protein
VDCLCLAKGQALALARPARPESSARYRQLGTTQVTLLSLEAMGDVGLRGTAQARGLCARSVEYKQVGSWPVAFIEDAGADDRAAIALLHQPGTTEPCTTVGIQFIEPPDT